MMDRKVFRRWLMGIYTEYAFGDNWSESLKPENAKKAKRFSHEVLLFMEKHDIINPKLK